MAACVIVPMIWERGTLVATAMTPVIVALVSEGLRKRPIAWRRPRPCARRRARPCATRTSTRCRRTSATWRCATTIRSTCEAAARQAPHGRSHFGHRRGGVHPSRRRRAHHVRTSVRWPRHQGQERDVLLRLPERGDAHADDDAHAAWDAGGRTPRRSRPPPPPSATPTETPAPLEPPRRRPHSSEGQDPDLARRPGQHVCPDWQRARQRATSARAPRTTGRSERASRPHSSILATSTAEQIVAALGTMKGAAMKLGRS